MSDWRTMAAGPELDRLIALKLNPGYRYMGADLIDLAAAPDGGLTLHARRVKPYSTDLNAAIGLIGPNYFRLETGTVDDEHVAWKAVHRFMFEGEADTPALAICRAFLAYQEAQERNEKGTG